MRQIVACVVPAYQAAATVGAVVAGLRRHVDSAAVVGVDDGSLDDTSAVLGRCCDAVIRFPVNRGKGAALRAGVHRALDHGVDVVLTIDADGQHDPASAPALLAALEGVDMAIGVRRPSSREMPLGRRFTNRASALTMSAFSGTALRDPQSGFRAYRRAVLERVEGRGDRYEYESDLLLRALRAGFRIAQVEVATIYGPPSHFLPVADSARVVRAIGRHWAGALGRRAYRRVAPEREDATLPPGLAT